MGTAECKIVTLGHLRHAIVRVLIAPDTRQIVPVVLAFWNQYAHSTKFFARARSSTRSALPIFAGSFFACFRVFMPALAHRLKCRCTNDEADLRHDEKSPGHNPNEGWSIPCGK